MSGRTFSSPGGVPVMWTPEAIRLRGLAIRAISSPLWRWLPGMLTRHEGRFWTFIDRSAEVTHGNYTPFHRVTATGGAPLMPVLPDFSDPMTVGGLLSLVRKGWSDETLYAAPRDSKGLPWGVWCSGEEVSYGVTESDALVGALERAYQWSRGLPKEKPLDSGEE